MNRRSKRFAVSGAQCDERCLELLPEGDIWAGREELCEAYTCVTGPHREPAAPFSFRSLPLFLRMSHFHGVCARFLISSEENNRYGYDYRSRRFDCAAGD